MKNKIIPLFDTAEIYLAAMFLISVLLKITLAFPTSLFIVLSLGTLAMIYFFSSVMLSNNPEYSKNEMMISKISFVGSAIGSIGILFSLRGWPGSGTMLMLGCGALAISLVFGLLSRQRNPQTPLFPARVLIRMAAILLLGIILFFTTQEGLVKAGLLKEVNRIESPEHPSL